ncbi:MAG: hypothetical protein MZV63_08005 [Marinilabiliales bacterium]|nr:hypothetical protein [Marinilabiliales bacterium]
MNTSISPSSRHCFQIASVDGTIFSTTPGATFLPRRIIGGDPHILDTAVGTAADEGRVNPGDGQAPSHATVSCGSPGRDTIGTEAAHVNVSRDLI